MWVWEATALGQIMEVLTQNLPLTEGLCGCKSQSWGVVGRCCSLGAGSPSCPPKGEGTCLPHVEGLQGSDQGRLRNSGCAWPGQTAGCLVSFACLLPVGTFADVDSDLSIPGTLSEPGHGGLVLQNEPVEGPGPAGGFPSHRRPWFHGSRAGLQDSAAWRVHRPVQPRHMYAHVRAWAHPHVPARARTHTHRALFI